MLDSRPMNTAMEDSEILEGVVAENNKYSSEPTQVSYREAVGSLMYLMIATRTVLALQLVN